MELTKRDLFNGVEEMIPAVKKILDVDTPDKNNMFKGYENISYPLNIKSINSKCIYDKVK